jgi:Cu+-exporting ATPase
MAMSSLSVVSNANRLRSYKPVALVSGGVTKPVTPKVEVSEAKAREEQEEVIMAKVKDVVCGMEIDPKDAAAKEVYKGKTYYLLRTDV